MVASPFVPPSGKGNSMAPRGSSVDMIPTGGWMPTRRGRRGAVAVIVIALVGIIDLDEARAPLVVAHKIELGKERNRSSARRGKNPPNSKPSKPSKPSSEKPGSHPYRSLHSEMSDRLARATEAANNSTTPVMVAHDHESVHLDKVEKESRQESTRQTESRHRIRKNKPSESDDPGAGINPAGHDPAAQGGHGPSDPNGAVPKWVDNPLADFFFRYTNGLRIWKWHHYFRVYHKHLAAFAAYKNTQTRINMLVIGVQSGGEVPLTNGLD